MTSGRARFIPTTSAFMLLAGILWTSAAFAGTPWNVAHFAASAKQLYAAASQPTPPTGAGVLVLDQEESYVFDKEGRCTYTDYMVYKVLTQEGVQGWDGMKVYWQPWRGERPTLKARVITADYVVHKLDPETVKDASVQDEQSNVYSQVHVLRAPLPAVAPGSVVESQMVLRMRAAFEGSGISASAYFGKTSVTVEHQSLTLEAPSTLPLHFKLQLLPHLQPRRIEKHGKVKLVFEEGPIAPLDPAEQYLPSDVPAHPAVAFSTAASWQVVADGYRSILNRRVQASDLRTVVSEITQAASSRGQKLTAITEYLDKEIRYTGIEFGSAAIIPHLPTQTLSRRYGDCKDKATLLVAMLRTAGIPAYVALLDAGDRLDVLPNLPAMDVFDHAIVYVPGHKDLWIDPTDRYSRVGQLPIWDQGRWALLIRDGTQHLTRIPESPAEQNLFVESRQFHLSEYGPARVVETDHPEGVIEPEYRRYFATRGDKDIRTHFTGYVESQYLAKNLDALTHSDPSNLSTPFEITLEVKKAKRGLTALQNAVVAIRLDRLFHALPSKFRERASDEAENADDQSSHKPRTADYQLLQGFVVEWDYKIFPPLGFEPETLPQNLSLSLGPARFTEEFKPDADGTVQAKIRFDTVKRRFTVAEATELRNKVAELLGEKPIDINFEPVGKALADQGKMRQAIQSYRQLIAAHPKDAVLRLRLADILLETGLGESARAEAREAVKLDPTSALAESTLAKILEHDIVGREFRQGSDYAGAEAAFRAAIKLDPKDKESVANLAILLEYNSWGLRYGPGANLNGALAEYHKLSQSDLANLGIDANPAFAEFYNRQFAAALKDTNSLNPQPTGLIGASTAVLRGSQAALDRIRQLTSGEKDFRSTAETASVMLADLGEYPLAGDLESAAESSESASSTAAYAELYRATKPRKQIKFPDNPEGVAERFSLLELDANLTLAELNSICSRNGRKTIATEEVRKQLVKERKQQLSEDARKDNFPDVGLDLSITRAQPRVQGNDRVGYKVILWPFEDYKTSVYIVKEQGQYKVLATSQYPVAIGLEVLDHLASHDLAGARQLLDWLRDDEHLVGGDDPLAGLAFPRFWTKGQNPDPVAMRLAAAAILAQSKVTSRQAIAILLPALKTARRDSLRTNLRLALWECYAKLNDYGKELAVAEALGQRWPESEAVFLAESFCLRTEGKSKEADQLAQARLRRLPDDHDAFRAQVWDAEARSDHALAHAIGQRMIAEGIATPDDLNDIAWESLFTGNIKAEDIAHALKSAQQGNGSFSSLHTLACLLAVTGKIKQARALLLQGMDAADLDQPDSACWLALGLIAEYCGERSTAIADYSRVKKPKLALALPDSCYALAQMHLKALQAKP